MVAKQLLERIPRLEYVAAVIGLQTKPLCTEPPPGLHKPGSLEFGAKLLKTCTQFDTFVRKGMTAQAAIAKLKELAYQDDRIIDSLARLPSALLPFDSTYVPIDRLHLRMILDQDVHSTTGVLLIASGAEVTEPLLMRLQGYHARGTVKGDIRVCIPQAKERSFRNDVTPYPR
jgi:hypothetical protein